VTNPFRRFLVFSSFSIGLVVYWFLTIGQSSDFPTGEVQYADMPALFHPYLYAWEAPYGVVWYYIQYVVAGAFLPFVAMFKPILSCPNNCVALVNYVNGTRVGLPFEYGIAQWIFSLAWVIGLAAFNLSIFYLLQKSSLLTAYFMTSMWFWATTPINLSILWIIMLAYLPLRWKGHSWGWLFLPLALIAKLPVGAPLSVWTYALHSGSDIGHWFPYALLGAWFLAITVHLVDKHFNGEHLRYPILHPESRTRVQL
jgi:hypothetical protein